MLCPRCAARSHERALECAFCGHSFAPRQLVEEEAPPEPPSSRKSAGFTARPGKAGHSSDEERLARLMREVQGGYVGRGNRAPSSRGEQEDDILRELLAGVLDVNRRIKHQKSEVDREALGGLYTARSFSSPEAMGRTTAAIRQLLHANQRIAGEIERVLTRIRGRVEAAGWSPTDKVRFWREIANGFAAKFKLRSEILEKQTVWSEATIDLYEFVLCNSEELSFEGKAVRTSDRSTGEEFVRRLKRAKQSRDAFRAAAARNEEIQAGLLTEWGTADSRTR
jgi:hypothetical protein